MEGKVVLITGASSGIGAGTAVHFASKGCLLSLTGRNQEGLRVTLEACVKAGAKEEQILVHCAELQNTDTLGDIVDNTINKFGKLDILVNNAGCAIASDFRGVTVRDYDTIMNTNLKSVFFLTQKAMPHLIKSQGNVVNVSSIAGQRTGTSLIAYGISKAALDHFTKVLALTVAPKNVRVNAVSPALIRTPIFERTGYTEDLDEMAKRRTALGRCGTVEEVTKAIGFLADNSQSAFITGTTTLLDGGSLLLGPS